MFFWQRLLTFKFRDEWGEMQEIQTKDESGFEQHPRLSDSELADQLETNVATVITHRRD
jgi:hypothetical protein